MDVMGTGWQPLEWRRQIVPGPPTTGDTWTLTKNQRSKQGRDRLTHLQSPPKHTRAGPGRHLAGPFLLPTSWHNCRDSRGRRALGPTGGRGERRGGTDSGRSGGGRGALAHVGALSPAHDPEVTLTAP
jgi:hypothetical protein